ncbi:hypothetical protein EVAR_63978_1 [Eumeta japonica]|uniref:Uncharacterized protein n=1 Tax=Eumeta variegata TaxID=151549 RepID=A0A4C1ZFL1_EUMVA|nr:hypothetical protein EVAR_63978_1 [Eumeta japonica]
MIETEPENRKQDRRRYCDRVAYDARETIRLELRLGFARLGVKTQVVLVLAQRHKDASPDRGCRLVPIPKRPVGISRRRARPRRALFG